MKFAIAGNGNSGQSAYRFLISRNQKVEILDDKNKNLKPEIIAKFDIVILSPGIPRNHPAVLFAIMIGIPIWNEIELAISFLKKSCFIGVTGSNGKSTTVALLGHILKLLGSNVFIGGNFGIPLCNIFEISDKIGDIKYIILELSSFQLETISSLYLDIAILLNLSPNHMDRYSTLNEYYAAKLKIFNFLKSSNGKITFPGNLLLDNFKSAKKIFGDHNNQNINAAIMSAKLLDVPNDVIQEGLNTFSGLSHRLEILGYKKGVCWVNDSKATTVDSVVSALRCFDHGVHLILGGVGKGVDYSLLIDAAGNCVRNVYLIGNEALNIEKAFNENSNIKSFLSITLENAVHLASKLSNPGDTILLSPACASYDQFINFEHRGNAFKELFRAF